MAISGDYRIDALLRGSQYRWNADFAIGTQTVVPYAFASSLPGYYQGAPSYVVAGGAPYVYQAVDEPHRTLVRNEFAAWEAVAPGLRFFETSDINAAVIVISAYTPTGTAAFDSGDANGYAPSSADNPAGNSRISGDLWLRTASNYYDLSYTWNGYTVQPTMFADLALHEIGHTVGLKHAGNYTGDGSGSNGPPYIPASEDTSTNTVMSYNGDYISTEPRSYDVLAIRFLYGSTTPSNNLWLLANDGNTVVQGSVLNELIVARSPGESIDGGAGIDIVQYARNRSDYTIASTTAGYRVSDALTGSANTITSVERLRFADVNVALDLAPSASAGKTAEILGAAFGTAALTNRQYVGIGLGLFDAGYTMEQVAQLCLNTGLVSAPDNPSFVTAVWQNVVGSAVDSANLALYTGLLASGAYTQASLLALAAETSVNQQRVDLAGLATTGVEYFA